MDEILSCATFESIYDAIILVKSTCSCYKIESNCKLNFFLFWKINNFIVQLNDVLTININSKGIFTKHVKWTSQVSNQNIPKYLKFTRNLIQTTNCNYFFTTSIHVITKEEKEKLPLLRDASHTRRSQLRVEIQAIISSSSMRATGSRWKKRGQKSGFHRNTMARGGEGSGKKRKTV